MNESLWLVAISIASLVNLSKQAGIGHVCHGLHPCMGPLASELHYSNIGIGSNSILGRPNVINIHCDAAICTAGMNINKRVNIGRGGGG